MIKTKPGLIANVARGTDLQGLKVWGRAPDIPCLPAYHQEIQAISLLDARQYAFSNPWPCILWAGQYELPGIGAIGEGRALQLLYIGRGHGSSKG